MIHPTSILDRGDTPDEWVQPTGSHDAYQTVDRVTYDGQVWESGVFFQVKFI